jgi:hypothetical protein
MTHPNAASVGDISDVLFIQPARHPVRQGRLGLVDELATVSAERSVDEALSVETAASGSSAFKHAEPNTPKATMNATNRESFAAHISYIIDSCERLLIALWYAARIRRRQRPAGRRTGGL